VSEDKFPHPYGLGVGRSTESLSLPQAAELSPSFLMLIVCISSKVNRLWFGFPHPRLPNLPAVFVVRP
jgi:hypothetical protein